MNVLSKNKRNSIIFHLKIIVFTAVKYCCILHGRVCVMTYAQGRLRIACASALFCQGGQSVRQNKKNGMGTYGDSRSFYRAEKTCLFQEMS